MKKINLHLGCGKRYLPRYIHIDIDEYPHIDYNHDIKTLPMFSDKSVDLIYTCGTFEYFDRYEALNILKEWSRVLKPKGILRISVPDFDSIVKVYLQNDKNLDGEGILGPLYGRIKINTPKDLMILYHKTVYDFTSLKKLLQSVGLHNVQRYNWWDILPSDYDDFSMAYIPYKDRNGIQMHLNVEANK